MVRFVLSTTSFLVYGALFLYLYPLVGSNVGALSFLPIIATGWLYGFRGGLVGALVLSAANAFMYPSTGPALTWIVPAVASVLMGAFVGYTSDLRQQLGQRQRALAALAHRDPLTGLLNRAGFDAALDDVLARPGIHVVMYMDLDGFKAVNDTLGHAAGDRVLAELADRLTATIRATDLTARIGGDEFVVALPDAESVECAEAVARRLVERMKDPIDVEGVPLPVTLSVGVALAPSDGASADQLLRAADRAMYRAKANGKNGYCISHLNDEESAKDRVTPFALLRGVREDQFALHFRPRVHLPSRTLVGFEADPRWHHPHLGVLAAEAFGPLAEETNVAVPLGVWAVHEACRQAAGWRDHEGVPLTVSVDVAVAHAVRPSFLTTVRNALQESGLTPGRLDLQLTGALHAEHVQPIAALARTGVRIGLHDLGGGYASLRHLDRLGVHRLKLGASFARDAFAASTGTGEPRGVARSLIRLAHDLDLTVLAAAVGTTGEAEVLIAAGCDYAQGDLYGAPLTAKDVNEWARAWSSERRGDTASQRSTAGRARFRVLPAEVESHRALDGVAARGVAGGDREPGIAPVRDRRA